MIMDDAILFPGLIVSVVKWIPANVFNQCRMRATSEYKWRNQS